MELRIPPTSDTVYLGRGQFKSINRGPVPLLWDWRDQNMVTPVKNQLTCNACWAFSAIGSIESHVMIYWNQTVSLSEQFLIDCEENSPGCGSQSVLKSFAQITSSLGGVLYDDDYRPYSAKQGRCRMPKNPQPLPVLGYKRVYPNEDEMVKYLYMYGPLSAGINSASMARYTHGIDQPTEESCSSDKDKLNHAVVIVGYNLYVSEDGRVRVPYWIIKNSWGEEWGDKGFYYLERGRNACGIASDVSFPFVK
ncbi:uncharacterized protein [Epargyreus clarus]|uniref:uncharacterized protein isoform X2 n=1 Tax=Epargyreus clarus TaxID=520877 RepID=UPI003C2D83B6